MTAINPYKFFSPKIMSRDTAKNSYKDFKFAMDNVESAFDSIQTNGNYMAARVDGKIPEKEYVYYDFKAVSGYSNHFQGIKRLRESNYFVFSGGRSKTNQAHLVIAKMGSRPTHTALRSNIVDPDFISKESNVDKIAKILEVNKSPDSATLPINKKFWHAGGLGLYGDILAVPIEGGKEDGKPVKGSQILFYSMKNPEDPQLFDFLIERKELKAGCVALTRLPSGRYLLAVLSSSDSKPKTYRLRKKRHAVKIQNKRLDFYLSEDEYFHNGFLPDPFFWTTKDLYLGGDLVPTFSGFQGIDLLVEKKPDESSLYLIGFDNRSFAAPIVGGKDFADLYKIEIKSKQLEQANLMKLYFQRIKKVDYKKLNESDKQSNFDAGAGVYIQSKKSFFIYGCYHWKVDDSLRFIEYHASPEDFTEAEIEKADESWVELYEHKEFKGRRLGLIGNNLNYTKFEDYEQISVQGRHFDKKVSSVRYQIAGKHDYILYKNTGCKNSSSDKDKLVLQADGKVHSIKNLKKLKFGDKVQSSKFKNA